MHGHVVAHLVVGGPDGRKTGGFGGHHVDAAAVFHRKTRHAGAHEFHDLVFHKAVLEHRTDDGEGHVLRANTGAGRAFEPHHNLLRIGDIVGLAQQLLDQLGAAFANGHDAQRAVAGVAV